jgi:hypothetical protein
MAHVAPQLTSYGREAARLMLPRGKGNIFLAQGKRLMLLPKHRARTLKE